MGVKLDGGFWSDDRVIIDRMNWFSGNLDAMMSRTFVGHRVRRPIDAEADKPTIVERSPLNAEE